MPLLIGVRIDLGGLGAPEVGAGEAGDDGQDAVLDRLAVLRLASGPTGRGVRRRPGGRVTAVVAVAAAGGQHQATGDDDADQRTKG